MPIVCQGHHFPSLTPFSIAHPYFWRVYTGGEIDYLEEQHGGSIVAFKLKRKKRPIRTPASWKQSYPSVPLELVSDENWIDFVT